VVWLTGMGVECAGLGGIRPVKAPPAPTTIAHSVLVAWSAARAERRGRLWRSARELALDRERWAVPTRCERGYTEQLPDLAVWLNRSTPPVAVIAESGGRREDRQKMMLEGWRDAIHSGRYSGVHYDCANASVARWINRLAKKVWLTAPEFTAAPQASADEISALSPAADDPDELALGEPAEAEAPRDSQTQIVRAVAPQLPRPRGQIERSEPPEPPPETPQAAAERERRYREIFGMPEPRPRRRWRR